jgi:superfamily II DNA or RNA helicase
MNIRLGNVNLTLEGDLGTDVSDEIRKTLSYVVPGHEFMPRYKQDQMLAAMTGKTPWDGTKTVAIWKSGNIVAPTGLFSYIREILQKHDIKYSVLDERPMPMPSSGWMIDGFERRDYQIPPTDESLNRQRGVIQAGTGAGKTEMMVYVFAKAAVMPAIFYVTSCDLLIQAHDKFTKYVRYNGLPAKIGIVGGGHFDLQPITICTVQTAEKALAGSYTKYEYDDYDAEDDTDLNEKQKKELRDLIQSCQCFCIDEAHHTSCSTVQTIVGNSHAARYRYGMSASPWRDDGLDILIEAAFGRKICEIPSSLLIDKGFLVPPTIIFNHFTQALGPAGNFNAHYTRYVVENDVRNRFIAEKALDYSKNKGLPTIILVKWAKHANILADLIKDCEVLTSSGTSKKQPKRRKEILDKMRAREVKCIIATTLLDEGVDVPSASVGIFAGGGKSSTRALQRVGRFIRPDPMVPGKQTATIEEFWDHTKWLMHHAKIRRKIYQTEHRYIIENNSETLKL